VQAQLEQIEVEPVRGPDDDLSIEYAAIGKPLEQCLVQLREVAIERPQVPALDEHL
jgi:hypothetical protein